jgi:alpha-mannosidase
VWAFSFNLAAPVVHAEEIGAIIRDRKKQDGGDYSNVQARYDYITVNHFADITDGANARGVTLANADCAFARLGASTPTELDILTPQINLLAGGQVDGIKLGIPSQFGNVHFLQRFALHPHAAYEPVAAMKFAMEHQNPLIASVISATHDAVYPGLTFSLLSIDNPNVLLWALKPHQDGTGTIARVWNLSGASSRFKLTGPFTNAHRVTHLETDLEMLNLTNGTIKITLAPQQMSTLRLQ